MKGAFLLQTSKQFSNVIKINEGLITDEVSASPVMKCNVHKKYKWNFAFILNSAVLKIMYLMKLYQFKISIGYTLKKN